MLSSASQHHGDTNKATINPFLDAANMPMLPIAAMQKAKPNHLLIMCQIVTQAAKTLKLFGTQRP
jgi:hypothetical protein